MAESKISDLTLATTVNDTDEFELQQTANGASKKATRTQVLGVGSKTQAYSATLDATTAAFTTALETKLNNIETAADVTDATNVAAAGALMDTGGTVDIGDLSATGSASSSTFLRGDNTWAAPAGGGGGDLLAANNLSDVGSASTSRTNLGLAIGTDVQAYSSVLAATTASFTTADESKLDGIEASADVTDAGNVATAGAVMTANNLSDVTAVTARGNLGLAIGTDVQAHSATLDSTTAAYTTALDSKLDAIEASADVTDATNVAAAGAALLASNEDVTGDWDFSAGIEISGSQTAGNVNAGFITYGSQTLTVAAKSSDLLSGYIGDLTLSGFDTALNGAGSITLTATAAGVSVSSAASDIDLTASLGTINLTSPTVVCSADLTVADEVYGAGWNASLEVPTKNAVYDKIEPIQSKLDGIETAADVTDATNVAAAGALMDSDDTVDINNLSATGTASSSTFLRGDNSWATPAGGGDVTKVATPVNNELAVWTGDGTLEGESDLTFDGTTLSVTGGAQFTGDITVSDEVYGVGWNASLEVPTKNAVYDKIETLGGGSSPIVAAFKDAIEERLNTDTVSDDSDLTVAVEADSVYALECFLITDGDSTDPDIDITFTGPTGATGYFGASVGEYTTSLTGNLTDEVKLRSGLEALNHITGVINTAGTAGSVTLQWAQNAIDAVDKVYILADSYLKLTKLN